MDRTSDNEPAGLRWTGDAVIDMGVAAAVLHADVDKPGDVTRAHWLIFMGRLEADYADGLLRKPSMILLTNNTFENPNWKSRPEDRQEKIAGAFALAKGGGLDGERCTFFPERRAVVRAVKNEYPLLQGGGQINFYPHGREALPLSDLAYGCVLALPLVSPVVSGRFAVVATVDRSLLLALCDVWRSDIGAEIGMLRAGKGQVERKAPKTHLMRGLEAVYREAAEVGGHPVSKPASDLTLYHLINDNQKPTVDVYTLPPHVLGFYRRALAGRYRAAFIALVRAFWRDAKGRLGTGEPAEKERGLRKNAVYEAMPDFPEGAPAFIRRFFWRYTLNRVGRWSGLRVEDRDLWPLLTLFLTDVMNMVPERIEVLRHLGDELAKEIHENNDRPLFRRLMGEGGRSGYASLRQILIRTLRMRLKRTGELLFTMDQYLAAFEIGAEYPSADWRLARDLVRIRCMETLHTRGYDFGNAPEVEEVEDEEEADIETE